ncbi:MAG: TrkH family potassium uptake protein [Spirochaetia bacterium]|nr:TrkH family potassium uptake protein [Spirochaetia bacterium]
MKTFVTLAVLFLAGASFYIETFPVFPSAQLVVSLIDILIIVAAFSEFLFSLSKAKYKRIYFTHNLIASILLLLYIILFIADKILFYYSSMTVFSGIAAIMIIRNMLILFKVFTRFQKFSSFLQSIAVNPAQTIVESFLIVIAAGTVFLAMPFASEGKGSLSILDSLFTATSAVCVTGLIVVDTATYFSIWGKIIIMLLIQIGGLGIMILSFSTVFMFRKTVSLENRLLISYMVNEDDMTKISSMVKNIVALTLLIEAAGALILFFSFPGRTSLGDRIFYSMFHAVSAFCNAGFALFSDSLEQFSSTPSIVLTVAFLIILGGISFSVMTDIGSSIYSRVRSFITGIYRKNAISTNSRVVLTYTIFLIFSGMLLVYFFEHGNAMKNDNLALQYLSAFFQSVTLRTAGFNSISFSALMPATVFIMIIYMFAGGASGSTAGGIKINTIAVILSYFKSFLRKENAITLYNREIGLQTTLKAFSILSLGITAVITGFLVLLITEKAMPLDLLFETVSAFATVGLSTGVTSSLSAAGKIVIIMLMFIGRLGPLTIVSSFGSDLRGKPLHRYPEAEILIG